MAHNPDLGGFSDKGVAGKWSQKREVQEERDGTPLYHCVVACPTFFPI